MSCNDIYMQKQLIELSNMIDRTNKAVERIERGQMNDRIDELEAGADQILLALNLDTERRNREISEGRSKILSAQNKLFQTFKSRVEGFTPIPEKRWDRFWLDFHNPRAFQERDKEFLDIQEYYDYYLKATQLLAASYALSNDMNEAEKVFELATDKMSKIRFDSMKTLDYIHKDTQEAFYNCPKEYIEAEKEACMVEAKDYNFVNVEVTGQKLLEVFENDRNKEIPKSDTKQ